MKILKSSFHFQPSDDLFPIDKFRQITEFIKITANLKRRFVMITTPDILTALSMVLRLEPIGNLIWQGNLEGNQFQIIPDIFHPMSKPGYILIRYVDADTVTLIEFEEHMFEVAGFDSIVCKQETKQETDEELFQDRYANELSEVGESAFKDLENDPGFRPEDDVENDPRYHQIALQIGDKYVFDPDICRPSTQTCGECIHGVCCEKAKAAKRAAVRKEPEKTDEPDRIDWRCAAEHTEERLREHEVPFDYNDFESSYELKFTLGKHKYRIEFKLRPDLSNLVSISKFDIDPEKKIGSVMYSDEVKDQNTLDEYLGKLDSILEDEVVEELAKEQQEANDEVPVWKAPIEKIEKLLYNYRIDYSREDNGTCHYLRYTNGYREYCVYFENRDDLIQGSYRAVFSLKELDGGRGIWEGLISSCNKLYELERAIVERIKPENEEC